jgi:putative hydrolase of the HAD superfamily
MKDRPTLILDADDTLWENNVFYEQIKDEFATRMVDEGFDRLEALQVVNEVECERIPVFGYSHQEFIRSIVTSYHRLCARRDRPPRPEVSLEVESHAERITNVPLVLLDGVAETLPRLRDRYRLILLTKGPLETQQSKVDRSGLAAHFEAVHVVPEKGPEVLLDLIARHGLDPARTWMVGNSARSDVNPAVEAGIGAIHIPHPVPWVFEDVALVDPEQVITLRSFRALLDLLPGLEERE